jgi:hypothetical protein
MCEMKLNFHPHVGGNQVRARCSKPGGLGSFSGGVVWFRLLEIQPSGSTT